MYISKSNKPQNNPHLFQLDEVQHKQNLSCYYFDWWLPSIKGKNVVTGRASVVLVIMFIDLCGNSPGFNILFYFIELDTIFVFHIYSLINKFLKILI